MTDIKSMNKEELKDLMVQVGEKPFRAKQIYSWLHEHLVTSYEEMGNIPGKLKEKLKEYPITALDPVDLVQHLGRKQVSGPASNGRGAETASHFAAHLGGNAHRVPMFITHENALDHISIRKTEQIFPCAVNGGNLLVHHFQGRDGIFLQFFF